MSHDDGIVKLLQALEPDDSLMIVATRIGRLCLDNLKWLEWDLYAQPADLPLQIITELTAELVGWWTKKGQPTNKSADQIEGIIRQLSETPALAYKVALDALCRGPLTNYFNWTSEFVELTRGSVFPLPTRRLPWAAPTPNPVTTHPDPLCPNGYQIWTHDQVVHLNYQHRDLLDEVCWRNVETAPGTNSHRLPTVGAVVPFSIDEMHVPPVDPEKATVFGVGPAPQVEDGEDLDHVVLERVCGLLKNTRSVEGVPDIAVLPECSLHKADLLNQLDEAAWDGLSPLLVAGSAHETVDGYNRNRSITYLRGVELIVHSKRIPFRTRGIMEDIAPPVAATITVACGTATRLAVAICADLNTLRLVELYDALGVNLLLIPAWTPKEGTFGSALNCVAGYSQCMALVANGPRQRNWDEAEWFYAMSIVPRAQPRVEVHTPQRGLQPRAGILDPNIPPGAAGSWTWV